MANTDPKDKPISAFELESTLDGDELIPIVKNGVNYKTTLADVRSGLATEERVEAVEDAQAKDLKKITELAGKLNGVDNVQEALNGKQPIGDYATRNELNALRNDAATKNELDVVETLAESVNQGLGETIQRVDAMETAVSEVNADLEKVVYGSEVIDGDTLDGFDKVTRDELKLDLFIDLWNALGVYGTKQFTSYNPSEAPDKEHKFNCNNVWLTYKEAIAVAEKGVIRFPNVNCIGLECRTALCTTEIGGVFQLTYGDVSLMNMAIGTAIETIQLHPRSDIQLGVSNIIRTFRNCKNLKKIIGKFAMVSNISAANVKDAFANCTSLEDLELGSIRVSISFAQSPLLSLSSLQYMVKNAANTAPITITVHPDVYAKLTTEPEWNQLLQDAQEKQITFATA